MVSVFTAAKRQFLDVPKTQLQSVDATKESIRADISKITETKHNVNDKVCSAEKRFNEDLRNAFFNAIDGNGDAMKGFMESMYDSYQLNKLLKVDLHDQPCQRELVLQIARDAAKAAGEVAEIEDGSTLEKVKKAKSIAKQKVIDDYFAAFTKYQKDKNEDSYQTAIKGIAEFVVEQKVKAKFVKKVTLAAGEDQEIIKKVVGDDLKKEMDDIIAARITRLKSSMREYLGSDRMEDRMENRIKRYKKIIQGIMDNKWKKFKKENIEKICKNCEGTLKYILTYIDTAEKAENIANNVLDMKAAMNEEELNKQGVVLTDKLTLCENIIKQGIRKVINDKAAKEAEKVLKGIAGGNEEEKINTLTEKAFEKICKTKLNNDKIIEKITKNIKNDKKKEIVNKIKEIRDNTSINEYNRCKEAIKAVTDHIGGDDNFIEGDIENAKKEIAEVLRDLEKEALGEAYKELMEVNIEKQEKKPKSNECINEDVQKEIDKLQCKKQDSEEKAQKCINGQQGETKKNRMISKYRLKILEEAKSDMTKKEAEKAKEEKRYPKEIDYMRVLEGSGEFKDIIDNTTLEKLKTLRDGLGKQLLGGNRPDELNGAQLMQEWRKLAPYAAKEPSGELSSEERYDYYQKHAKRS